MLRCENKSEGWFKGSIGLCRPPGILSLTLNTNTHDPNEKLCCKSTHFQTVGTSSALRRGIISTGVIEWTPPASGTRRSHDGRHGTSDKNPVIFITCLLPSCNTRVIIRAESQIHHFFLWKPEDHLQQQQTDGRDYWKGKAKNVRGGNLSSLLW